MKNSKSILVFTITIGFLATSDAIAQNWDWAVSAGGKEVDYATGIVNDAEGNVYVTGSFNGTATFGGKQLTSEGYYDIFVAKYNPEGQLLWISQAGGNDADESNGIALDVDNNIYITGYFSATAHFGNLSFSSKGDRDFFLAKYDSKGQPLWVQQGGGSLGEFGRAVAVDKNENIFVTGIFGGTAVFNKSTITSKGAEDIFIAEYNKAGDLLWINRAGGSGKDEATAIATGSKGDIYLTGWFSGVADFGKTSLTSNGDDDIFIAKYNTQGNVDWVKQAGGYKGVDRSYGITVDAKGNCYVTGSFNNSIKFGSVSLKSIGADDCFLVKYNDTGSLQWVKQSSGKNDEIGRAITCDTAGNIYVCGDYNATFICNSTQNCVGDWDIFIIKYDKNGTVLGANRAGGEGYDRPIAMCLDKYNNCFITGVYDKSCLFGNHQLLNKGSSDIFISKTKSFDPVF